MGKQNLASLLLSSSCLLPHTKGMGTPRPQASSPSNLASFLDFVDQLFISISMRIFVSSSK